MQDPNADTEWNDVLRRKGIIPEKAKEKEITEDEVVNIVENVVQKQLTTKEKELTLDDLDELEDEEDERILLQYRNQRIAEMKAASLKAKYGDVRDISAVDYVDEVNKAGEDVWVILHLYKSGIPLCSLVNQLLLQLAAKFPATKFLRSISTTCIPNFPDKDLPAIFIYYEGQMKKQITGAHSFSASKLTLDELEWILAETGAIKTTLESDPRPKVKDVLFTSLQQQRDDDDNDW